MEIKPYLRTLDQEYTEEIGKTASILCSWAESKWRRDVPHPTPISNISCLRDFLWLRREDNFGFVYSDKNEMVFFADQEAINLIEANLDKPLKAVRQQHPQLLEALQC